ncbi:hypothetical protein H2203_007896 [Taxawa tesnikishii (nom. ined.)]|nr:hypothetical protein H2203_007896 [Dothideales sp. JES 119]
MGEFERASALCAAAEKEWNGRIDGVLRMEGGFEIILCEFKDHLRVESIKQVEKGSDGGPGGPGGSDDDHFDYYRAVAARYDGIGGGRVRLNYEDMVTAFADPELLEWDAKGFPRITTRNATAVHGFRDRIARMITQGNSSPDSSSDRVDTDWQAVTDLIVSRYADRIEYLTSGSLTDLSALKAEAARALRPFIDFGARDPDRELHRCATQFLSPLRRIPSSPHPPSSPHDAVAYRAVQDVSAAVCAALSSVSTAQSYRDALSTLRELKSNLAWTSWKSAARVARESDVGGGFGRGDGERYWDGPGGPKRSDEKEGR